MISESFLKTSCRWLLIVFFCCLVLLWWGVAYFIFDRTKLGDSVSAYQIHRQLLFWGKLFLIIAVLVSVHLKGLSLGWPISMVFIGYLLSIAKVNVVAMGPYQRQLLITADPYHGFLERTVSYFIFSAVLIFGIALARTKSRKISWHLGKTKVFSTSSLAKKEDKP